MDNSVNSSAGRSNSLEKNRSLVQIQIYANMKMQCKSGCHWDSKSTLILLQYGDWWSSQGEIKSSKSNYVNNSRDTVNSNPRGYICEMKDMSYLVSFDDISQTSCVRWIHFRNRVCEQYCPSNINVHYWKVTVLSLFYLYYCYFIIVNCFFLW